MRLNVVINVEDFAATAEFYRDVLEMPVLAHWDGDEGPGIILEAGDGRTVEFFGPPWGARRDAHPTTALELAFEVDDVDGWHDKMVARGVSIARGLIDNPWGDRSFGIDDPAGLRIWMLQAV